MRILGSARVLKVLLVIYYLAWLAVFVFVGYLAFQAMKFGL